MKKISFDEIRNKGLLIYSYVRGSTAHGIRNKDSDIDKGGIYLAPVDQILGLGLDYQDQISNETNDIVWYELQKFMNLLLKSNPTVLEALFVDDKYVEYEHPIMTEIKKHKEKFLTKKCFDSFFSYARSQIKKASGLNKKINWDIPERKELLDFVYTFHKQGSSKIKNWMEYRNLKQQYCGLVNIPNMPTIYGVYYDWGNYFLNEGVTFKDLSDAYKDETVYDTIDIVKRIKNGEKELEETLKKAQFKNMVNFIVKTYGLDDYHGLTGLVSLEYWFKLQKPIGYKGMVNEAHTSTELRLSSVEKGVLPICHVSYYKDSFQQHCRVWKEYQDWVKHRNPVRYESNLKKSYDAKNMCECFRLINCGIEIARGEGYKVDRSGIDAEFLLDVKNHKYEYEELMEMLKKKNEEMEKAMAESTIPEEIDIEFVNNILLKIRKEQLGINYERTKENESKSIDLETYQT